MFSGTSLLSPRWGELEASVADRSGFLGFKANIKIVPDRPTVLAQLPPDTIAPDTVVVTPSTLDLESSLFSRLSTFGDGDRLSVDGNAVPESTRAQPQAETEVSVVRRIDPVYPPSALEARQEGRVTVRVCVGENGLLKPFEVDVVRRHKRSVQQVAYVVVHEEPPGYSFADNLLSVLPLWRFRPMSENGNPVEGQLDITYRFVLSGARKFTLERVPSNPFRFRGLR